MNCARVIILVFFLAGAQAASAQLRSTNYGTSVFVAFDEILVGEPNSSYHPGSVYAYAKNDEGSWTRRSRLTASNAENYDGFGSSLDASGDHLVIGALRQNDGKGGAYVFERRGDAWVETARLYAAEATSDEKLGRAVAIDGDVVAIGAPATTRYGRLTPATKAGAVYVFRRNPSDGIWAPEARLEGSAAEVGAAFGQAVEVHGDNIYVGAPQQDGRNGAVYVFKKSAEGWLEERILSSNLLSERASLGADLAYDNGLLYVGAPGHDRGMGAISIYQKDEGSDAWQEQRRLVPLDGPQPAYFGASVAVSNGSVWSGAPLAANSRGDLYIYDGASAESGRRFNPSVIDAGTFFGYVVASDGPLGAVSIPEGDGLEGIVAVVERGDDGSWDISSMLRGEEAGLEPITGGRTDCQDGKAALFDCSRVDLLSFLPVNSLGGGRGTRLNDLWGWTDPETGKEYVIVGRTDGTAFVDITDPENPIYLGDLPLTKGAQPTVWRDMKVYKDHAFIVADGTLDHGMQVFDLRQLRSVASAPKVFKETAIYDGLESAHNVVINEESGFAYTVGGDKCGGGLHMVDIRDPQKPTFAGCFTHLEAGSGSTHDAQCVMYHGPDTDYRDREICLSSNGSAFSIADVTDKANPKGISSTSFPNHAYIHQGWLTEDHRYFFMNDELDEFVGNVDETRTLIWDVSDLDDPQLIKEYLFGSTSADHNLYIDGPYMYQSNYLSGLHVHDVSNPEEPRHIAHFDTVPVGENTSRLDGSWSNYPFFESGVVPVSSKEEGLFLLKVAEEKGL